MQNRSSILGCCCWHGNQLSHVIHPLLALVFSFFSTRLQVSWPRAFPFLHTELHRGAKPGFQPSSVFSMLHQFLPQHQINIMYYVIRNLLNLLNIQCKCLISGTGDQKERSWSVLPRKHSATSNTKEIIKIVQIIRSQAFSDVLLYTLNAKAETPIAVHVQQYLSFINIVLTMKRGIDVPFYQGWLPLICNM